MMRWPAGKGSLGVYAVLLGCALAVCAWQRAEHLRFERSADGSYEVVDLGSANGSFVNEQSRWLEGDPNLVTGYSLLALSHCR